MPSIVPTFLQNTMPENSETLDPRSSLIDDLLSRQDDVIRQLDELDVKLLATIEAIRPSKDQNDAAEPVSEEASKMPKAA